MAQRQAGQNRTGVPAPYAPESNPDEYLNRNFNTALYSGPISHDKASLLDKAMAFMNTLGALPDKVSLFPTSCGTLCHGVNLSAGLITHVRMTQASSRAPR
ncbi:hypothetical protein GCM10027514_31500 [Azotobacter armeniacus]